MLLFLLYALFELWGGGIFLFVILSFSDTTLNPLFITHIILKIFKHKTGMYADLVHIRWWNITSILYYNFQSPQSYLVIILFFLLFTIVFNYHIFVMFLILLNICDVYPDSATKSYSIFLLIVLFSHTIVSSSRNSLSWTISWTEFPPFLIFICHLYVSSRWIYICNPSWKSMWFFCPYFLLL